MNLKPHLNSVLFSNATHRDQNISITYNFTLDIKVKQFRYRLTQISV